MISASFDTENRTGHILLRADSSLSWRGNMRFLIVLTILSLSIASGFLALGLWPVLPFAVLEMGILCACLYHRVRQCHRQEIITLSVGDLILERGFQRRETIVSLSRQAVKVLIARGTPMRLPKVLLSSDGWQLPLGDFLNQQDSDVLIKKITEYIRLLELPRSVTEAPLPIGED